MAAGEIEPGSPTLKPSALALSYGEGTRLSEMAYERPKYSRLAAKGKWLRASV